MLLPFIEHPLPHFGHAAVGRLLVLAQSCIVHVALPAKLTNTRRGNHWCSERLRGILQKVHLLSIEHFRCRHVFPPFGILDEYVRKIIVRPRFPTPCPLLRKLQGGMPDGKGYHPAWRQLGHPILNVVELAEREEVLDDSGGRVCWPDHLSHPVPRRFVARLLQHGCELIVGDPLAGWSPRALGGSKPTQDFGVEHRCRLHLRVLKQHEVAE